MNQSPQHHQDREPEETDSERRTTNIVLAVAAVLVIGGGIWLANAMVNVNKAQLCVESGRRNCNPIAAPPRSLD
jgi:hypothetical protein